MDKVLITKTREGRKEEAVAEGRRKRIVQFYKTFKYVYNNLVNIGQLFIILFTHVNFEIKSYLSIFIVFSFFEKGFNYIYCYKYLILLLLIANL